MTLAAFRVRSFRFQWPADLLTSWSSEMESIILGWYVMVHTGSVLMLTAFGSLQFFGTLLAPMIGVLGDRLGGRFMLCALRAIYVLLAAVMMVLALTGTVTTAWVFVLGTIAGIVRPSDQVMRNALIGETIPQPHLTGALGMSRATMDSARVAGALAGAALSTALGMGRAYVVVAVCYLASLVLTSGVARAHSIPDPSAPPQRSIPRSSRWRDLKDGLRYVVKTPALFATMWLAFLVNLTAYPASSGLLPYVARQIYMVDATGLGWLVASFSVGGLLASIAMVATGGSRRPERTMLVHVIVWYVLLLGFGSTRNMMLGLVALLLAGFVQNVAMISMAASLLADADDRFRGRVMGVRQLAVYGMPLGLIASGVLIESVGFTLTVTVACAVGLIGSVLIGVRWRTSIWQRRRGALTTVSVAQRL